MEKVTVHVFNIDWGKKGTGAIHACTALEFQTPVIGRNKEDYEKLISEKLTTCFGVKPESFDWTIVE